MDVLKGMTVFVAVAKQGSFAAAARELQLSRSAVSRLVLDLEEWLGAPLFNRTTRALSLTDAGRTHLERCELLVAEADDIRKHATEQRSEAQGPLRITAPLFVARYFLQDLLPAYLKMFPKVELDLVAVDRMVDIIAEGFDIAIRAGVVPDSSLISRRLMDARLLLVASPDYLKRWGRPESPTDLANHNCIVDTVAGYANRWPVGGAKSTKSVPVHGNVKVNSGEIARNLALADVGITLLPEFMVAAEVREGRLVSLLDDLVRFEGALFALYPHRRSQSPSVRTFIDHAVAHVTQLERRRGEIGTSEST